MKKKIYWTVGVIFVAGIIVAIFLVVGKHSYVAKVNGEKISEEDLNEALVTQYGSEVLDSLIVTKITDMEIEKEGIEVTQAEIDEEMQNYYDYYGGEEGFKSVLEESGADLDRFKQDVEQYIALNKILEKRIEITDEEIAAYFEENQASFAQAEQVEASHILVEDEATANEVLEKLTAGEDFAELAKTYSLDTTTSEAGGELGYFSKGTMGDAFDEAAFALDIDAISDPVETDDGFEIIKVTDKKAAKDAELNDEVKEEIRSTLLNSKISEEYNTWLDEKYDEYEIENNL
ncbi:peptidylprolyl isomerase [Caldibacillus lycopersici]|uniref:peptidylprolyl isomerase n=1 Tax=Perspicuibacillus lycopersici TaxID=1325689 RepID=A0AAE3IU12_9BACI|nr:peptidylprolyl isomerase [Perspicuibacillus lycopersici]MCU9614476.1 peptidylprolyl isomerase [Perspicuibacillus lycopersici]